MNILVVLLAATALVDAKPMMTEYATDEGVEIEEENEMKKGKDVRFSTILASQEPAESKGKRYFEEFFHKKTQEEKRRRIEELKKMNQSQQRKRREQRRRRKLRQRQKHGMRKVRVNRDLPRIDCRVRSPSHVVNLLLLIHSQKVRDEVAGRWLAECGGRGRARSRPSTAIRYFG